MREPALPVPTTMTRAEYRDWAMAQPGGRFELVDGVVVATAPERAAHARVKAAVWVALRDAIVVADLPCEALPDGMTVEVGDDTDFEPDAVVDCGDPTEDAALAVKSPVIVVEVSSRSTAGVDKGVKLSSYFRVSSILHYLLVRADRRVVIHHARRPDGSGIDTRIVGEGELRLDPPGLVVDVARFYEASRLAVRGPVKS